ncbi:hypothetical protein BSKO_06309 [Bryopsis sp. KO-2023]|nr:hypothetical protein BSKO_06309 [Bryopsis sp. KO-2023]
MPMHLRFGKAKLKTPTELVAKIISAISHLSEPKERTKEKALEDVGRYLEQMKVHLFGDEEHSLQKDTVLNVATAAANGGLFLSICMHLGALEFESRKDAAQVFGALLRIKDENDSAPMANYIKEHPAILEMLFNGYQHTEDPHMGLNCGSMLRDCIRHEELARLVLDSPMFLRFFEEIEERKFEIAADAFATFKDLIIRHKELVAEFLEAKFDDFFFHYKKLLKSENFFTRRQLLKLLGELLMEPANVRVMVKYVADVHNLILMMNLLRDQYESIQYEAFHVFKVFVANPSKPPAVKDILKNNKDKLLKYLENFHTDRAEDDEQFQDEKNFIVKEISLIDADP